MIQFAGWLSLISALALGAGLACHLRKSAPRFVAWCAFIVGWGIAGWVGVAVIETIGSFTLAVNNVGKAVIGLSLAGSVVVFLFLWFVFDVRKKGKVTKVAPLVALILPSTLPVLVGVLLAMPATRPVGTQLNDIIAGMR